MDVCVKEEVLETLIVTKKRPRNDIVWHLLWVRLFYSTIPTRTKTRGVIWTVQSPTQWTVHLYSILGCCQGLLKGIVSGLALNGYTTVTFDMRGIGKSTSRASLTGFSEVKDVIVVCNCLSNTFSVPRILLLGSSISMLHSQISHFSYVNLFIV